MANTETLDILIVGGGPAGTAAAFRASELGLSAMVVDYDDRLKRIRDYAKDKLILPNFGGGDQMGFVQGGERISSLRFEPIDKDEMCRTWKELSRKAAASGWSRTSTCRRFSAGTCRSPLIRVETHLCTGRDVRNP